MSSADFRQIAVPGDGGRPEKLFRAAVSAFTSLTRPTRRDAAQLDDLTAPLYGSLSTEARRFAAAALSDVAPAPQNLVRRLADEPVEISAPLLVRSQALATIDLIALIGRHGISHARAIACRAALDPTIAGLAAALEKAAARHGPSPREEAVRRQLRDMMRPTETEQPSDPAETAYERLRDTALTGTPALFQTALADIHDLAFAVAQRLTAPGYSGLLSALRALDLSPERAFLLAAAVLPNAFGSAEAIRLFLQRYAALDPQEARAGMLALAGPQALLPQALLPQALLKAS